jgi:HD superfamily phosphohydrolase
MYSHVYFHPLRRIYDIHLRDFLREWLQGGRFSVDVGDHLKMTDNEAGVALRAAADDPGARGHDAARRIEGRDHYRVCYSRNPNDVSVNPDAGKAVFSAASEKFGTSSVRHDKYSQKGGSLSFPVRMRNGDVVSALAASEALPNLPVVATDYVFIDRGLLGEAPISTG